MAPQGKLVGRDRELRAIDRALADARLGRSSSLVIRGDAGIGKTALLRYAVAGAASMRVLSARGVEFEADVPFAGLHELLRPALGLLERLPPAHAVALRSSLGLGDRVEADRLVIGASTLGLLSAYAEESPLLVTVDDAQWLDPASAEALAFAFRRLLADPVAVLVTLRAGEHSALAGAGLPELGLEGLDREAAAELLARAAGGMAPEVAAAILDTTGGNPLAVLELAGEAASLPAPAGPSPLPIATTVERTYLRRAVGLSAGARRALLLVATAGAADLAVVEMAALALGLAEADVHAAEGAAGLVVERDGRIEFVHPLARAALYHSAPPAERRAAHRALAAAMAEPADADRRAWHLAAAASGRDQAAADALEGAGRRARERTAYAAAAGAFEESARLTEDGELRARRLLAAADNAWIAGRGEHAVELLTAARALAAGRDLRLGIDALLGHIALRQGAVREGFRMQVATAAALRATDRLTAARVLATAIIALYGAGYPGEWLPAAREALALLEPGDPPEVAVFAHVGFGALAVLAGLGDEGPQHLHASLEYFAAIPADSPDPDVLMCAGIAGTFLRKVEAGRELLDRALEGARRFAPAAALPAVLFSIARDAATTDRWTEARGYYEEALRLARETTQSTYVGAALAGLAWLDGLEGREADCRAHAAEAMAVTERLGLRFFTCWALTALGMLELGAGRAEAAIGHFLACQAMLEEVAITDPDLAPAPELVDAYLRAGREPEARSAAAGYDARARAKGQPFALARAARVRGLLAAENDYAAEFEAALGHHAGTLDTFDQARTRLHYGERLRRSRRRVQARVQLRAALAAFDRLGARPWAERASAELTASGESARVRDDSHRHQLTPQEMQVALALAEGRTTREAAAKLYLSPKTVEYHLRNVYDKLEIRSREELQEMLGPRAAP